MALRPAFYALGPGRLREAISLLHAPYTALHLAFIVLGAACAPVVRVDRLVATLVAFFLAVGVSAHGFDELRGRPLRTHFGSTTLFVTSVIALVLACLIGVAGVIVVSPVLLVFIAAGAFMVLAYNLELFDGAFHGDVSFALFWGVFPFLTAYWVMDESLGFPAVPGAAACFAIARLQRALSTPARLLRRRVIGVHGTLAFDDGAETPITRESLLAPSERALAALCAAVPLLAAAALWARL